MVMKVYPPEFKADAVALYLSDPTRTIKSVAQDLGISRETLRLWVRQAQAAGTAPAKAGPAGRRSTAPLPSGDVEAENKQLKARIRELELERDILRRAAKYFAGETNW